VQNSMCMVLLQANHSIGVVDVGKDFCSRTTSQGITQVFQAPRK